MYVCLCNGLTDRKVREAVEAGATQPKQVYAACECRAQCGRCVKAMLAMMRGEPKDDAAQPA